VAAPGDARRGQRDTVLAWLRVVFGIVLFAVVLLAVVRSWNEVRSTLSRIGLVDVVLAELLVLVGLAASALTWRVSLRELGSTVRVDAAAKIYLLGQLGKYVPGSVWALALQMELATRAGVSRRRGMTASVFAIAINVMTGLLLGLAVVPTVVSGRPWLIAAAIALAVVCAVALSPSVLTRLVDAGLRALRRPPVGRRVTWRGLLTASAWSIGSWLTYGMAVWVLTVGVGAPAGESLGLCLSGVALAMTAGFLVVIAPSGIGVREGVFVAALSPVLPPREALAVALAARLVFTVADLIAAAVVVPVRIQAARTPGMEGAAR
jgi:uncharacterized membrane protein YbhN (UPF0104 family)